MATETDIVRRIMLTLSKLKVKIFRNNTGSAWIGESFRATKTQTITIHSGDVVVRNARFFQAGLCVGSSDLIGWQPVIITPEMVGTTIARFVACEVKKPSGRATKEQINFIDMVNQSGGIGFIAKTDEEAANFINRK